MKIIFTALMLTACCTPAAAQTNETYAPGIASLQVMAGERWMSLPVIRLGADGPGDRVNISFDDLTHAYRRYTYSIEHCEADWTASDQIFTSDYVEGFSEGNTIGPGEESVNTDTLYTHYRLTIPNAECSLKMSGNYRLTVYDEDNGNEKVLEAEFMVVEPLMQIGLGATTNTDIDLNDSHQQLSMSLNYGSERVTDPAGQIYTVVTQNNSAFGAKVNPKPNMVNNKGLQWNHCRDLIFEAGNEYRKYEILALSHATMGIETIGWDGNNYNAYPFVSTPRQNYLYDEDANGAFYIRNSDNIENDYTCDYVFVHYKLKAPEAEGCELYVDGMWATDADRGVYAMEYDRADQSYNATILQKQGYYSYRFVGFDGSGRVVVPPSEGNFYQTENRYQAYAYYKGAGERTWRLVAYRELQFRSDNAPGLSFGR